MATSVIPFKQAAVPAHVQKAVAAGATNIDEKLNIPQLSFRGKVWRQVIDGEERPLLNKEEEPVSTVQVVVLNHQKARSRAFYEGNFVEGKSTPPACWSNDGDTPDSTVKEPQSRTCAKCPQAVKGSKITPQGHETTACAPYKRLVVVPLSDLSCQPMLLRLAQTSTWDKKNDENEKKGFYAWDQFTDMLREAGAVHTGFVATKIRFDSRVAYPKLVFAASRWLEDEELEQVKPLFDSEAVMKLLNASEAVAAERKPKDEDADDDEPIAKKKAKAAPVADDDDDDEPAAPPKKKAKAAPVEDDEDDEPAPPPKKKVKAAPVEDDDDDEPAPPPKKKVKAAPVEDEEEDDEPAPPKKAKKALPTADADDEEEPTPKKVKPAPEPEEEEEEEPAPVAKKKAKAAPVEDEEEDEEPAPKKVKGIVEVAKKKAKAAPVEDDEEDDEPAPVTKKKAKADNGLADLVDEFND